MYNLPTKRSAALSQSWFVRAICTILCATGAAVAQDQKPVGAIADYLNRVGELNRSGRDMAVEFGKQYLIGEYRTLLEAFPDFEKNIQLETRIAEIFEWDLSARGEPPNLDAAYAVYLDILNRYDTSLAYTKLVYRRAADMAETLAPDDAKELYQGMLEAYPEDAVVQLEGLYRLAQLAERDGNHQEARQLFDMVLQYKPTGADIDPDAAGRIKTIQEQAAVSMMALAIQNAPTPEERIDALDRFLEQNPQFASDHAELANRIQGILAGMKEGPERNEMQEAMDQLVTMLAERDKVRAGLNESTVAGNDGAKPGRDRTQLASSPLTAQSVQDASIGGSTRQSGTIDDGAYEFAQTSGSAPHSPNSGASASSEGGGNRIAALTAALLIAGTVSGGLYLMRRRFG